MIQLQRDTEIQLISLSTDKGVYLEGNILKVVSSDQSDFNEYLEQAKSKDSEIRNKRLNLTKQIQERNKELEEKQAENDTLMVELQDALNRTEQAKTEALNEVSILQKKSQFELIGEIVKVALFVIVAVGVVVTGMYVLAMTSDSPETTLIGNTWSNLFGILLTNSFSIIGTIMGVKYADDQRDKGKD
jgi:hypothetical protein